MESPSWSGPRGGWTWFVRKRPVGYTRYFDTGYAYGKNQFISMPGSCWATMALALAVESRH